MWLHIILNSPVFAPSIQNVFEKTAPGENVYGVFCLPKDKKAFIPGATVIRTEEDFKSLIKSRSDWKGIIFNPIMPQVWPWFHVIPESLKVIWYCHGFEAYAFSPVLRLTHQFLPETRKTMALVAGKSLWKELKKGFGEWLRGDFKAFRRVDIFVSPVKEEYDLFRAVGWLSSRAQWKPGSVGALEMFVDSNPLPPGPDIQVGHSAVPTSNHIDAFRRLAGVDLSGRKVIVPLSYGDMKYREHVLKAGRELLGDHFEPVLDYLPLAEYLRLLNRCGFLISNHLRQAAIANVAAHLWNGSKVYMNSSPLSRCFKRWGMRIYSINSKLDFSTPEEPEQILKNRRVLEKHFSETVVLENTRQILEAASVSLTASGLNY